MRRFAGISGILIALIAVCFMALPASTAGSADLAKAVFYVA